MEERAVINQIALIRILFDSAAGLSRQRGVGRILSVLGFHDTVELLIILLADRKDIPTEKRQLNEIVGELEKGGFVLIGRSSFDRLNKIRTSLKHHAIWPSSREVQLACEKTRAFLVDNCRNYLNVDFESVDLLDFVESEAVQNHIKDAQSSFSANDGNKARESLFLAFEWLVQDISRVHKEQPGVITFPYRDKIRYSVWQSRKMGTDLARTIEQLVTDRNAVQDAMIMLTMGIDLQRHQRFAELVPAVIRNFNGEIIAIHTEAQVLSSSDFHFCVDYLVDLAISLQDEHADYRISE